jgi:hypothetical protein
MLKLQELETEIMQLVPSIAEVEVKAAAAVGPEQQRLWEVLDLLQQQLLICKHLRRLTRQKMGGQC